jgi:hypothetical protein
MRWKLISVRVLTAAVLFIMLAQANVWADTQAHTVLAVGYRAFLLATPFFVVRGLSAGMWAALALCVVGIASAFQGVNGLNLGLIALGMAVSGYIVKSATTHTSRGAADNKVALNVGSLLSGLLLLMSTDRMALLSISAVMLIVALVLSIKIDWNLGASTLARVEPPPDTPRRLLMAPMLGWGLIGIATGIKLTGIFTVLPRFLLHFGEELPSWFGYLIMINSAAVVFFQHKIMLFLDSAKIKITFLASLSAMAVLALPSAIHVEHFPLAILWVLLLTFGECALSRYDRIAKEAGYLFPKELMVGVGSFATVMLSRMFSNQIYLSGLVGIACLSLGTLLLSRQGEQRSWFLLKRNTL